MTTKAKTYAVDLTIVQIVELAHVLRDRYADFGWQADRKPKDGEELTDWEIRDRDAAVVKRQQLSDLHEALTGEPLS